MNDRYLFRGKRIDNGEWVQGYYFAIKTELKEAHYIQDGIIRWSVDPETISQFTGLTDKNGVKIFEGDILRIPDYSKGAFFGVDQQQRNITIELEKIFNGYGYYGLHYKTEEIEVIGNIHDK